jgi:hypothetical protein
LPKKTPDPLYVAEQEVCSSNNIRYRLYLPRKLDRSAQDIAAGRVHSTEQAKELVRRWFTPEPAGRTD